MVRWGGNLVNTTWMIIFITSMTVVGLVFLTAVVYYFLTYRKIKKQREYFEHLHQNLSAGQMVEFANGLIGKLRTVGTETCDIEIKSGAVITVSRYTISRLIEE